MIRKIIIYFVVIVAMGLVIALVGCDTGLKIPGSIRGKVTFSGEWPESLQYCYLVVAKDRPPNDELDITYLADYVAIPIGSDSFRYEIYLNELKYHWIIVACIADPASLTIDNVVGEYRDPANPDSAGSVDIKDGIVINNINVFVNFDSIGHIPGTPGGQR